MFTVLHFEDMPRLSQRLAADIANRLQRAVELRGKASLVLTGGRTPKLTFEELAEREIDWRRVHIFWGDDRWLPHDHPDSNFGLARVTLLDHIPLPDANLHAIPYGGKDIFADAAAYDGTLRNFLFGCQEAEPEVDETFCHHFDVTLLGMGEDGHVASLFPGHAALAEKKRLAIGLPEPVGIPAVPRVTMTFAALVRSRCVMLLISGPQKKRILGRLLSGDDDSRYPAAQVAAEEEIRWYTAR